MIHNESESAIGKTRQYSKHFKDRNDVVLWDVIQIDKEQLIKVAFLDKNSPYFQGIRLAVDVGEGILETNGVESKTMHLWYHTSPRELIVKCKSKAGLISVYNIFQKRHFPESQLYGSGMIIEQDGAKTIYKCHDVSMENVSFDKIIFSIEKIYEDKGT